ncbi:Maf family protein [Halioxenophilus sp. WMMB6]|uniref:Maf family protein n=1 Tax=Halioxenophilus sp. WMMB6 TaxID=3073815 RepID=UPI00295E4C34|nr:Maf family protein [Halioxenophilus sp. WMMB6]
MPAYDLILASQSPRRREILQQIGVRFCVQSADIEERHEAHEAAAQYAQRLAEEKALTVARLRGDGIPVLGADTIGVCAGHILEKPVDESHARAMLQQMSATTHQVISALAITNGEQLASAVCTTQVKFRALTDAEIARYWQTGEPQDKSGGYAIQGFGAVFVESITGSYSNVVGLPIESLVPLLQQFAIPFWQTPT